MLLKIINLFILMSLCFDTTKSKDFCQEYERNGFEVSFAFDDLQCYPVPCSVFSKNLTVFIGDHFWYIKVSRLEPPPIQFQLLQSIASIPGFDKYYGLLEYVRHISGIKTEFVFGLLRVIIDFIERIE